MYFNNNGIRVLTAMCRVAIWSFAAQYSISDMFFCQNISYVLGCNFFIPYSLHPNAISDENMIKMSAERH